MARQKNINISVEGEGYNARWVATQSLDAFIKYGIEHQWGTQYQGSTASEDEQKQLLTHIHEQATARMKPKIVEHEVSEADVTANPGEGLTAGEKVGIPSEAFTESVGKKGKTK